MGKKLLKTHKIDFKDNEEIKLEWYSVKVNFNYEQKAADTILELAKGRGFENEIVDVIVPIIETTEMVLDKEGKPKKKKKRTKVWGLDGYIWVKMSMNNETWNIVRNASGVAGWLNADGRPLALSEEEVDNVRRACGYETSGVQYEIDFEGNIGDLVEIIDGPMKGIEGQITDINEDTQMIKLENENGFKFETEMFQVKIV